MKLILVVRGDNVIEEMHSMCVEYETVAKAISAITQNLSSALANYINEFGSANEVDPDRMVWKFDKYLNETFHFNFSTCDLKPLFIRIVTNIKEEKNIDSDLLKDTIKKLAMMVVLSFWDVEIHLNDIKELEKLGYDGSYGNSCVQISYFKNKWKNEKEKREEIEKNLNEAKEVQRVLVEEYRTVFLNKNQEVLDRMDLMEGAIFTQEQVLRGVEEKTFALGKDINALPKRIATVVATLAQEKKTTKGKSKAA